MTKTYEAVFVPGANISPDAMPTELDWKAATLETRFTFPWEDRPAPATEFRALFDEHNLYFTFGVEDADIVLVEEYQCKTDVMREDRVELFFALHESLSRYYCIEIDPLGRVLDYSASHYRQFDFAWTCPGLNVTGKCTRDGYTVEGRIPLTTFASLGFPPPDSGQSIIFGIYRAEFRHMVEKEWEESWISWVDPRTAEPDFHVPASFGCLRLRKS